MEREPAETGIDVGDGRVLVAIDPAYLRPSEVDVLIGDASKARRVLGWSPRTNFEELVREMAAEDVRLMERVGLEPMRL